MFKLSGLRPIAKPFLIVSLGPKSDDAICVLFSEYFMIVYSHHLSLYDYLSSYIFTDSCSNNQAYSGQSDPSNLQKSANTVSLWLISKPFTLH